MLITLQFGFPGELISSLHYSLWSPGIRYVIIFGGMVIPFLKQMQMHIFPQGWIHICSASGSLRNSENVTVIALQSECLLNPKGNVTVIPVVVVYAAVLAI